MVHRREVDDAAVAAVRRSWRGGRRVMAGVAMGGRAVWERVGVVGIVVVIAGS